MSKDIIREGGILLRKHRATPKQAKERGWTLPYKIEMLEISSIDFNKNDTEKKIYNGVQVDRFNRPKKLWFKGGKSVSFDELIMYSSVTRITQYNGVSPIYPSLPSISNQEDHATAETKNATNQSQVSDVYKTKIADTLKVKASGDYDEDIVNAGKKEVRKIDPRMPEGKAKIIDENEEYTRLDRGSYASAFDSLNKFANTRVAANIGITLDEYTQDLSELTFHGGQVAQIKNDETYSIIRDDLVELVINPFMEDMVKWCYITGYTEVKPENIDLKYIKRPRKSAQPSKDATAWDKNYKNKFMTQGDIVKEISGETLSDFLKRYEKEEMMKIEVEGRLQKAKIKAGLIEVETNTEENTNEN
jgi:capsid protein